MVTFMLLLQLLHGHLNHLFLFTPDYTYQIFTSENWLNSE